MYPPVYAVCSADAGVTALLGSPTRLFPFGLAPQDTPKPYAVWSIVTGAPENYLGRVPDIDTFDVQLDVYGDTAAQVRAVGAALRDAIEPVAHVTFWRGERIDDVTRRYSLTFETTWLVNR